MLDSMMRSLRDAGDILRRARNPAELAKALVPNQWLSRHVLNEGDAPTGTSPTPTQVAEALKTLRDRLKADAIDTQGQVHYAGLVGSDTYVQMQQTSRVLQCVNPVQLSSDAERLAFWINVYNVLAIHGVIALEIRASVMEMPSYFGTVAYQVGDWVFTLDEIENGVLRRNAPHPATGARLFQPDDPRLATCPNEVDPRIHAALVCASTSCPPVSFYDAAQLETQLKSATLNYVAADVQVDEASKTVRIPITFKYYAQDFGGFDGVRAFLIEYAEGAQAESLRAAFDAGFDLSFHRYNWSLNAIA